MARCVRAAFVGPVDVTADDGIRTRDLRFTKPLLYQLSYVGGKRPKHCIPRRFTQARCNSELCEAIENPDRARLTQTRLQRQHECLANFPQRNAVGSFT